MPVYNSKLNPYDLSKICSGVSDRPECYPSRPLMENYLNLNGTRALLGVDDKVERIELSSHAVNTRFMSGLDMQAPGPYYVAGLLERGVDVLIYAGTYDWIAHWIGNLRWVEALEWRGKEACNAQSAREWFVHGEAAGITKAWNGLAFTTVEGAGHLVPYDKPVQALAMVNRWLERRAL